MIVAVVDYRAGNLASVVKALAAAGATPLVVSGSSDLQGAAAIVIPGVGHFEATRTLDSGHRRAIGAHVEAGVPLLGICLGMQWLFEGSDEAPDLPGLGLFPGRCSRLAASSEGMGFSPCQPVKIPHVGWNTLEPTGRKSQLLDSSPPGMSAYFTHSYAAPVGEETMASTTHGVMFASVVERGRIFGTQFHPEKSGAAGIQLLSRFISVAREANTRC